ncbi:YggN family protein [Cognatiluteimonas telluris]|jgi:hypothetical protein|uniref:YggN family protein n=1 Tax=Cognatiluteimonas telluris TaxID=1104775 RepID=UPI00140A3ACB|nr:YggN family protein [Lysobacter telluris]
MTKTSTLLLALSFVAVLGACDRARAPTATPAAATTGGTHPETMLGRAVESAMTKARHELETSDLDLGGGSDVRLGAGHHFRIGSSSDGSRAKLTPRGDLIVNDKPVPVTQEQRALLLDYRREVIGVAETGMAIGVQGADLAGKAVLGTISGLLHGDADETGDRFDAEGDRIEAQAMQICTQLPAMLATQQRLAASLPAFKPFANMTQEDIDDCRKDGASVTTAERGKIRDEVRQQVRENVRGTIRDVLRHRSGDETTADDTATRDPAATPAH